MKPVYVLLLAICALVALPARAQQANRPNIVLFLIDDLGWADLSSQGSIYYETPQVDGLAAQGVRFVNAYAAASICSPSRAALLTGRSPARIGLTDWIRARFQWGETRDDSPWHAEPGRPLLTPANPYRMELDEVTLAELLQQAGYVTAHMGKWHLGTDDYYPEHQGFAINRGGSDLGQPPSYFDPYTTKNTGSIPTLAPRKTGEYLTDRLADEAAAFVRENRDRPFFLHMAHYAVHTPLQAKDSLIARYKAKPKSEQSNATYAAMVHSMDEAVGKVLKAIDDAGIRERTLIVFTSDNGGLSRATNNAPLREGKGFPYEGGLRVPLYVRWPGHVPEARVSYEPVIGTDLFPTILDVAGVRPPDGPLDGISLWDHLRTGARTPLDRENLFWHFPHYRHDGKLVIEPYSVVRSGDWKLVRWYEGPRLELYNLREDPFEQKDVATSDPERTRVLDELLSRWLTETGARMPKSATP